MQHRTGNTSPLAILMAAAVVILAVLTYLISFDQHRPGVETDGDTELFMFCAAGMRLPIEKIATEYQKEYGVHVQLQYGGSNTLLNQIEVGNIGDLYLAADDSYIQLARDKGFVEESVPIALMIPVIGVPSGNPKGIHNLGDLLRDDVRVALANPDQAAVGKAARRLLTVSGHWEQLDRHVRQHGGVYQPTVSEVANAIKLGSVDAGIIWNATAAQYDQVDSLRVPELEKEPGVAHVTVGLLSFSKAPTAALRFARYIAARDRGLPTFLDAGFEVINGDAWAEVPEMTFFAGSVNRRALEPIIKEFSAREGVRINTIYNGCGILTAQMRSMADAHQPSGFPDMYMACDVYYLKTVQDLFQAGVDVSNTDIVIVVQKGNPKGIQGLQDLIRPGMRVAIGQPEQCTIGVLSKRLLEDAGIYDQLLKENVVTQTATSALLVPNITTGSADAILAYATDTLAERDKLDVVAIDSDLAKAVQPYSVSRSTEFQHLGRRLFDTIARSRDKFEAAGFVWRLAPSDNGKP